MQISSAGAQEQHDRKRTQLHSRQISLSGLSGGRLGSGGINIALKMSELNPPRSNKSSPESGQRSRWRRRGLICRSLEEASQLCLLGTSIHHPSTHLGWAPLCSSIDPLLIRCCLWAESSAFVWRTEAPDASRFSSDWRRRTSLDSLHRLKTSNRNLYGSRESTAVAMTMCNLQWFVGQSELLRTREKNLREKGSCSPRRWRGGGEQLQQLQRLSPLA